MKKVRHAIESYFSEHQAVSRKLIITSVVASLVYFFVLMFWFRIENAWLFAVLMLGQAFYLWQGLNYLYTVWDTSYEAPFDPAFTPPVDVFITVAGEPKEIVEETVRAAFNMDYPDFRIYILNDGYVAKKDNWRDMEELAAKCASKVECITRTVPGGAKAGNINNALARTLSPYIVIFDADHVPHRDFLKKTSGYFIDPKMGFVQTPQYYKNYRTNEITRGAWEQQEIYYGAICKGRNRLRTTTMCGTNMMIRREALEEVGGMCDFNIAEDFITGMFMHERGWESVYVPEVLAQGLAPEDFLSYQKQQLRWARGSLELFFRFNPLFRRGLSWKQRLMYLSAAGYYLSGLVVLMNALFPLIFFFAGAVPFAVSTMALTAAFLPYIFLMIYTLQQSTNYAYTFRALAFSMGSFVIHLQALFGALFGRTSSFAVTSKTKVSGNFIRFALPHVGYVALVAAGVTVALLREGLTPSLITNTAWAALNIIIFSPFIAATTPEDPPSGRASTPPSPNRDILRKPNYEYAPAGK